MPHVDEGDLHRYLDGGPGSEGSPTPAEIARHLEACQDCLTRLESARQVKRRASAILEDAAPRVVPPPFEAIVARAGLRGGGREGSAGAAGETIRRPPPHRRRRGIPLAWAASIALAVGAGWFARPAVRPERPEARVALRASGADNQAISSSARASSDQTEPLADRLATSREHASEPAPAEAAKAVTGEDEAGAFAEAPAAAGAHPVLGCFVLESVWNTSAPPVIPGLLDLRTPVGEEKIAGGRLAWTGFDSDSLYLRWEPASGPPVVLRLVRRGGDLFGLARETERTDQPGASTRPAVVGAAVGRPVECPADRGG